ncbi:hypothetical protein KIL84_019515 [Mauremys mutica]|uniref:Uncharacterized protein n=1 Tax=Mauremys mutica TaxID=74926 RepID=A0A9D4BAC5_9SAUR|nr:hypothetical protein KIL84_019515 [Mauremys mutica]
MYVCVKIAHSIMQSLLLMVGSRLGGNPTNAWGSERHAFSSYLERDVEAEEQRKEEKERHQSLMRCIEGVQMISGALEANNSLEWVLSMQGESHSNSLCFKISWGCVFL